MHEVKKSIDKKGFYSLYEIARDDLFETGLKTFNDRKNKCRSIIMTDKMTKNRLAVMLVPDKVRKQKKYSVCGANIIKWLANKDDAKTK